MKRRASLTTAWLGAALTFGFAACGDGDATGPPLPYLVAGAGEGGDGGDGAVPGTGGRSGSGAGDATGGSGADRGGSRDPGGSSGASGSPSNGGSTGGGSGKGGGGTDPGGAGVGNDGGEGGTNDGGAGGEPPPDRVVCDRIDRLQADDLSGLVTLGYERAYLADCRVSWFLTLYGPSAQRLNFLRNLTLTTLALWGCTDEEPTAFSLIYSPVPLSRAEVNLLITLYLNASRAEASLTPSETAPIERKLKALAAPLIDPELADFSRSRCATGGMGGRGGMAGAGGAGAGGAGAGGITSGAGVGGAAGASGSPSGAGGSAGFADGGSLASSR
ncbi:MAG TPA: hypothetical protein VF103_16070 [Polyangiaceae bacterium]